MSPGIRNTVLGCVGFMVVMLALFMNNAMRERQPSDDELRERGIVVLPKPRALTDFQLLGSNGAPFTPQNLQGQWTFAYFGFTNCPDICPITLSVMGQARQLLQERGAEAAFEGVLVSVDPERDTPAALAEYVEYFSPSFMGVTGTRDAIAALAGQVSVAFAAVPSPSSPDGYVVDHTGNIVMINPRGHYHGYIRSPHSAEQVADAFEAMAAKF